MKYLLVFSLLFIGCAFDAYDGSNAIEYAKDNTLYSIEASSGDVLYFDGTMKSKTIGGSFQYSCYTNYPCLVFVPNGGVSTIRLVHNGTEYAKTGEGMLIITIP